LESEAEYNRLIAVWLANGRRPPQRPSPSSADLRINELLLDYCHWAEQRYRDQEGNAGREVDNLKTALRPLWQPYGHTPGREFEPLKLQAVQEHMAKSGLCRTTIYARINRVRRFFKWAVSFERLPAVVH
jgi:hypothetical protein